MKALDVYFLMVVFMLFLNVVHDFANLVFNLDRENQFTVTHYELLSHVLLMINE